MSDLIAVIGNITTVPERKTVSGDVAMVTFGLASTERRYENGGWRDVHTNFYNVSVFRKLAEHAALSLERGQRVIVAGKLRVRQWEQNGRSGTTVDLDASSVGPDLLFGTATFTKSAAPGAASEAWSSSPAGDAADGSSASGATDDVGREAPTPERALVGASAWGEPSEGDVTPF